MNDEDHDVNTGLDILSRNFTGALDKLVSEKHFIPRKKCYYPWIGAERTYLQKARSRGTSPSPYQEQRLMY